MSKVLEVIDTLAAYTNTPTDSEGERLPLGAVKVRTQGNPRGNEDDQWAVPLGPIRRIPLVGEHVFTFKGPSWSADPTATRQINYYMTSVNAQDSLNIAIIPQQFLRGTGENDGKKKLEDFVNYYGIPQKISPIDPFMGQTFQERGDIKPIQPYEGDTIIDGRWGQAIRFSSTVEKNTHRESLIGKNQYAIQGCNDWEGPYPGAPIMFITNGIAPQRGITRYTKESWIRDEATICMTSGQKLKTFKPAQPNLGVDVITPNKAAVSQVAISSDRLHFNAKREFLILSAKRSVQIATPDWAADMNEILSIMEEFLQVMQRITNGSSPYPTVPGIGNAPTMANPEAGAIASLVSRIQAQRQ